MSPHLVALALKLVVVGRVALKGREFQPSSAYEQGWCWNRIAPTSLLDCFFLVEAIDDFFLSKTHRRMMGGGIVGEEFENY